MPFGVRQNHHVVTRGPNEQVAVGKRGDLARFRDVGDALDRKTGRNVQSRRRCDCRQCQRGEKKNGGAHAALFVRPRTATRLTVTCRRLSRRSLLIRRRSFAAAWRPLLGAALIRAALLRGALRILFLRALLITLVRVLLTVSALLILLAVSALLILTVVSALLILTAALLHLPASLTHRGTPSAHLLTELVLLIRTQNAHQLTTKFSVRLRIARAAFGMRLRILVDDRLHPLLLVARKVEAAEPVGPTARNAVAAGGGVTAAVRARAGCLALLSVDAERHRKRHGERAGGQERGLHGLDGSLSRPQPPERRIRT